MLSREDNELLTRVGPGTGMGELMRRFWMPVLLSAEIAEPDCTPVRIRLLGEPLIAFRDTDGRVGLVDENCPHRLSSLYFGRNEECGIRCVYHGWKFDVDGNCVDMPSEPADSNYKEKVKLKAYPVREAGGVVWAYMGPAEKMGEPPAFDWMDVPEDHRYASRWVQDCNYAQCVEGEIDSAHVSFLHSLVNKNVAQKTALAGSYFSGDRAPKWKVIDTDWGMTLGARRGTDEGQYYWRMNQWYMPFYTMIAPVPGEARSFRMWVPSDDEHTSIICVSYRQDRPVGEAEVDGWKRGVNQHAERIPGTLTPVRNAGNEYMIDREKQRTENFSGIEGVRAQDAAMVESAGRIVDRTREHLGTSDTAVIRMRRLLLGAAKALANGEEPRAAAGGDLFKVRSYSTVIDETGDFDDYPEILEAMGFAAARRAAAE
jgi:phenylpropionate dioxygenase-like ring-hydroxylating dioxygenase large terminal subunit